jgi:MFS family permease
MTPFTYKDFRLYFCLRGLETIAVQIQITVIGFYVYAQTHSKLALALVGLSEVIPALGLALYGGYLADRKEKRALLLLIHLGLLLTSLCLCTVTLGYWWVVYGVLMGNGFLKAFYEPVQFSIYTNSIPKELYVKGASWVNLSWQGASVLGPVLGGLLYAYGGGMAGTSAVLVGIWIVCLVLNAMLDRVPGVDVSHTGPEGRHEWLAGLRYVWKEKMMLYAMTLDLCCILFGGVGALLPVYALDILHVGASGLGAMKAAIALGSALCMGVMLRHSPMNRPWRNLLLGVIGFGLSVLVFGLSKSYWLSLGCLFMYGALDSVSVLVRGTLLQWLTPEHMRGRVSAVNHMFISSSAGLGDAESGFMAAAIGTVPAVVLGGFLTLAITCITWTKTRSWLGLALDDLKPGEKKRHYDKEPVDIC